MNSGIMFSPKTQRGNTVDQPFFNNRKRGLLKYFYILKKDQNFLKAYCNLPETNSSPLNMGHPRKETLVFQRSIFRCYVIIVSGSGIWNHWGANHFRFGIPAPHFCFVQVLRYFPPIDANAQGMKRAHQPTSYPISSLKNPWKSSPLF